MSTWAERFQRGESGIATSDGRTHYVGDDPDDFTGGSSSSSTSSSSDEPTKDPDPEPESNESEKDEPDQSDNMPTTAGDLFRGTESGASIPGATGPGANITLETLREASDEGIETITIPGRGAGVADELEASFGTTMEQPQAPELPEGVLPDDDLELGGMQLPVLGVLVAFVGLIALAVWG